MELTMYDFERYIQKDMDEVRAEQMWDNKSKDFYERTEKNQKQFTNEFVFQLIKDRQLLKADSHALDIGVCSIYSVSHRYRYFFKDACVCARKTTTYPASKTDPWKLDGHIHNRKSIRFCVCLYDTCNCFHR